MVNVGKYAIHGPYGFWTSRGLASRIFPTSFIIVICTHLFSTGKSSFYVVPHKPNTNHRDQTVCQICYKFQHDSDLKNSDSVWISSTEISTLTSSMEKIPNASKCTEIGQLLTFKDMLIYLPEEPENQPLEKEIPFGKPSSSGSFRFHVKHEV